MKRKISIIVGGTGQFGIHLNSYLLKKKHHIFITTRNIEKARQKIKKYNVNAKFIKLNIFKKKDIERLIKKYNPDFIFYFAGLSSPKKSFDMPEVTFKSNYLGCKNFLETIKKNNFNLKFVNASSCEIFSNTQKKLNLRSKKKPISPYGKSKLMSYNLVRKYRNLYNLNLYNAIIFNTESIYRSKDFLIPKICLASIRAYKYNKKTYFGNLNISREWNWCQEQVEYLYKFVTRSPQDFILSNGKNYTAKEMLDFAFSFFKLNYRNYVFKKKKFMRTKDFKSKKSSYLKCLKRNNIERKINIHGRKLIHKLIKNYLNEI